MSVPAQQYPFAAHWTLQLPLHVYVVIQEETLKQEQAAFIQKKKSWTSVCHLTAKAVSRGNASTQGHTGIGIWMTTYCYSVFLYCVLDIYLAHTHQSSQQRLKVFVQAEQPGHSQWLLNKVISTTYLNVTWLSINIVLLKVTMKSFPRVNQFFLFCQTHNTDYVSYLFSE